MSIESPARSAPAEARAVSDAAARISRLPSREWNIALLEAHVSLFSGDKERAVEHARRALKLMTVERDALIAPMVIGIAATVMAWAGEGAWYQHLVLFALCWRRSMG